MGILEDFDYVKCNHCGSIEQTYYSGFGETYLYCNDCGNEEVLGS